MRKCPQHGYEISAQVHTFYNGLNYSMRALVDASCGGSITTKTVREANQLFEELAKNNYQAPSERNTGRNQGGLIEVDRMSSLEEKFDALITRLNQQAPRELTIGEIAYMQTHGALMANPPLQIEDENYVNNRSYTFRPNNNLHSHYHSGLRNHENFSYNNQVIVPHEPHQLSNTMAPPGFYNQGAFSSNYHGNARQLGFNDLLLVINDSKRSNEA